MQTSRIVICLSAKRKFFEYDKIPGKAESIIRAVEIFGIDKSKFKKCAEIDSRIEWQLPQETFFGIKISWFKLQLAASPQKELIVNVIF